MAKVVPPMTELTAFVRGDEWASVNVTFLKAGFDFTGITAAVKLRTTPDGPLIATLTPSVVVVGLGELSVAFGAAGAATALYPSGTIFGDVELSRTSPAFGPKTWLRFQVDVVGDVTHA